MLISELLKNINEIIPLNFRFLNDPVGLLVGSPDCLINGVIVSLDLTEEVIIEAREKDCNLIVTHHPLFYSPLKNMVYGSFYTDLIKALIINNISLISLHACLDLHFTHGVSRVLAENLGLKNIEPLISSSNLKELESLEVSNPNICSSIEQTHAFGCIGNLPSEMNFTELKSYLSEQLSSTNIRFAENSRTLRYNRIAVVGGSGAKYWQSAYNSGAELFLTSEIDHHLCLEAKRFISLADATHYTTEKFCIHKLKEIVLKADNCQNVIISASQSDPFDNYIIK